MPQPLRVDETIVSRTLETEVIRNANIPSSLPAAERVVSVNARVEITDVEPGTGYVIISGVIRSTIFFASAEDPSNVVSFKRSFTFTDRVRVQGARPGLDADIEALITDIDFNLISERLVELEFTVVSELDITAPDTVTPIGEVPEVEFRRREFRIQRQVRERNFSRDLESIVRLPSDEKNIRRLVSVESTVQISEITTGYDRVRVRGRIDSDVLYVDEQGQIEFVSLTYGFNESFPFRGITPDMKAFVNINVTEENIDLNDRRRVRISTEVLFNILVVEERVVELPTEVLTPDRLFPVRRTVIVERVVVEQRTRISSRELITIPEGNPNVDRVISVSGNIQGGSIDVVAEDGGVLIDGIIDANIIYVADLPDQPVYFTPATITFSNYIDIPEVESDMQAYADISINRITGSVVSENQIRVRAILNVDLLVTERVRVPVITDISREPVEQPPTQEPTAPGQYVSYVVQLGDTLYLIAQRYGTTVDRLIEINNITNPEQLEIGQRILVPAG
ncbi:MAG: DUF3794 and LysM peptidoglycan-binding domain-containing protein [Halothermotrichaceae bacterium]